MIVKHYFVEPKDQYLPQLWLVRSLSKTCQRLKRRGEAEVEGNSDYLSGSLISSPYQNGEKNVTSSELMERERVESFHCMHK